MAQEWQKLTGLTNGAPFIVERIRLPESGIAIEGEFELPPLGQLSSEDQFFVAAFVRSHGSIKEMERLFGVSYPTIKNRLRQIGECLSSVAVEVSPPADDDILEQLEQGEITASEAANRLRNR